MKASTLRDELLKGTGIVIREVRILTPESEVLEPVEVKWDPDNDCIFILTEWSEDDEDDEDEDDEEPFTP